MSQTLKNVLITPDGGSYVPLSAVICAERLRAVKNRSTKSSISRASPCGLSKFPQRCVFIAVNRYSAARQPSEFGAWRMVDGEAKPIKSIQMDVFAYR
jgi:hypothetical protein